MLQALLAVHIFTPGATTWTELFFTELAAALTACVVVEAGEASAKAAVGAPPITVTAQAATKKYFFIRVMDEHSLLTRSDRRERCLSTPYNAIHAPFG
ncbi:hypothetical protein ACFWBB_39110 [Streptomyces sp. NPDC060000]|uniref:hypothetical protein n=1 Tax=Streptomyces sp. NPDC060000 TaxID=3347031 RepID=UPI0036C59B5E